MVESVTRLLGELNHDECAPWCDHDPESHTETCSDSFCDGYKCWESDIEEMRRVELGLEAMRLYMLRFSIRHPGVV